MYNQMNKKSSSEGKLKNLWEKQEHARAISHGGYMPMRMVDYRNPNEFIPQEELFSANKHMDEKFGVVPIPEPPRKSSAQLELERQILEESKFALEERRQKRAVNARLDTICEKPVVTKSEPPHVLVPPPYVQNRKKVSPKPKKSRQKGQDDKFNRLSPQNDSWQLIRNFTETRATENRTFLHDLRDLCGHFQHNQRDFILKLLEDIGVMAYQLINANKKSDFLMAIVNFAKLRTDGPLLTSDAVKKLVFYFNNLIFSRVQGPNDESPFKSLRAMLNQYTELKQAPVFKKLYKFLMYSMSLSLFSKIGVDMDTMSYTKMEQEAIRKRFHMGPDFVHSMLDTLTFICERGYQCVQSGSLDPIYHSGSRYESWFDKAAALKRDSQFLTNPELHGFTKFQYLSELTDAIEAGESICTHATRTGDNEAKMVKVVLSDLILLKRHELTRNAASQERKVPFSVLIHGGSSVAKSTFTTLLFTFYGKLFGLPTESEYKYTRNPADKFWTLFQTSQWCIQLDDIAFLEPANTNAPDPSLIEMLQVINMVPFVPSMADIVDKGRTPVQSRFVIATTNTEDLNATAYFSCPLAIQRRLPWIIDIQPKPEYRKDGVFLDGTKVPELLPGELPDYWIITVKRVIPASDTRKKQRARIIEHAIYNNIADFLVWFAAAAREFDVIQAKALKCGDIIHNMVLCKDCSLPVNYCTCIAELQTGDEPDDQDDDKQEMVITEPRPEVMAQWYAVLTQKHTLPEALERENLLVRWRLQFYYLMYYMYVNWWIVALCINFLFGKDWVYKKVMTTAWYEAKNLSTWRILFRTLGVKAQRRIGCSAILLSLMSAIVACYGLYRGAGWIFSLFSGNQSFEVQNDELLCTGVPPIAAREERNNPWYKDDYQTTSFDVSSMSKSYKALPVEQLDSILLENSVHMVVRRLDSDGNAVKRPVQAICVGGHVYMCNNHSLPDGTFNLELIQSASKDGVNRNITFLASQSMIRRIPQKDIAFIRIRNVPPKKDISQLFCEASLEGKYKGYYLARKENGEAFRRTVDNVHLVKKFFCKELKTREDTWQGIVTVPTKSGDCGSVLIGQSSFGPIILGIHYLGTEQHVFSLKVTKDLVLSGMALFGEHIVQSGVPNMKTPSVERVLGELSKKSPFRYIDQGTANVYGSFVGFRTAPKTRVKPTVIAQSMMDRGYVVNHTAPLMHGYLPWRRGALDCVKPVSMMNQDVLEKAKNSFIKDILAGLSSDSLKEVHVYDTFTAINGAAGVTYVDKINRNTSAGFPWNKSKKYLMKAIPEMHDLPDPVEVDGEVLNRAEEIVQRYLDGERAVPIYTGALKDEAVKHQKYIDGKTRIFTGAPLDHTIVTRKYLLSFIRCVQKNRFLFESGPGTIAQSIEWEHIRSYLVTFGVDKIIAGDFKAFDKRMASIMILAAFDVIKAVCKAAGYTDSELKVISGIAADTAFAWLDFNGDLVEFFGGNPSGHALTVIINGIVNCLYMRYAFIVTGNKENADEFKQYVKLMTYGDDNNMGVSDEASFFSHTSIQQVLGDVGIEYTMADKTSETVPYIDIDDSSFLKRKWVYDPDIGAYVGPLEEESIIRSLMIAVSSKTISAQHQILDIIGSAVREYFYYGKVTFHEKKAMFKEIIEENELSAYVQDVTFPSWDDLYEQFWQASAMKVQSEWEKDIDKAIIKEDELRLITPCWRCYNMDCTFKLDETDDLYNVCHRCGYCSRLDAICHCGGLVCFICGATEGSDAVITVVHNHEVCLQCLHRMSRK